MLIEKNKRKMEQIVFGVTFARMSSWLGDFKWAANLKETALVFLLLFLIQQVVSQKKKVPANMRLTKWLAPLWF